MIITYETLRKQIYEAGKDDPHFDAYDAMKLALEDCKRDGVEVVHRKSHRSMKSALKKMLDSPEYELCRDDKVLILSQVISDLLKGEA